MNIVLIEPEIHWNTGNIGRTCVATGTALHLVGPLGFRLDHKSVRRAGLDYWPKVRLFQHEDTESFFRSLPGSARLKLFSAEGKKSFWDAGYGEEDYLVFGKESVGLPRELRKRYRTQLYRIPISEEVRSLNLSTAAAVVLYEALRQQTTYRSTTYRFTAS